MLKGNLLSLTLFAGFALAQVGQAQSFKPLKVGDMPPKFDVQLLSAPAGAKADLRALKGKVVVLEFWATWCGPCIAAMPHVNDLAEKFEGKPVTFMSLSIEPDNPEAVKAFLKKATLKSWVGIASAETSSAYGILRVPQTIILGKDGRIAAVTYPLSVDEKVINDVLAGRKLELPNDQEGMAKGMASAPPEDLGIPELVFEVAKVKQRANGSRMGPGIWDFQAESAPEILRRVYRIAASQIQVEGDLPEQFFRVTAHFPKSVTSEQADQQIRTILPGAMGVTAELVEQPMDVLVLTCPDGPKEGLRKPNEAPGHAGASAGFSSGVNAVFKILRDDLTRDLKIPVIDETGLGDRYFSWTLKYKSGDIEDATNALTELGVVMKKERRTMPVLIVRPIATAKPNF